MRFSAGAKSKPVEHGLPFSTWSLAKLADHRPEAAWEHDRSIRSCRACHAHALVHHVVGADPLYQLVDILGTPPGKAHNLRGVAEFCRRAGLD